MPGTDAGMTKVVLLDRSALLVAAFYRSRRRMS
jgi:hypothetical protein